MRTRWQHVRTRFPSCVLAGVILTLLGLVLHLMFQAWLFRFGDSYDYVVISGYLATGLGPVVGVFGLCLVRPADTPDGTTPGNEQ